MEYRSQHDKSNQDRHAYGANCNIVTMYEIDFHIEFVLDFHGHENNDAEKPQQLIGHSVAIEEQAPLCEYLPQDNEARTNTVCTEKHPAQ